MWQIRAEKMTVTCSCDGVVARIGLRSEGESPLPALTDRLPERFYELCGFLRSGFVATRSQVESFAREVVGYLFEITGADRLFFLCSQRDARAYQSLFRRVGRAFSVVAGSIAGDEPISYHDPEVGGSDDEQVCMIEHKHTTRRAENGDDAHV